MGRSRTHLWPIAAVRALLTRAGAEPRREPTLRRPDDGDAPGPFALNLASIKLRRREAPTAVPASADPQVQEEHAAHVALRRDPLFAPLVNLHDALIARLPLGPQPREDEERLLFAILRALHSLLIAVYRARYQPPDAARELAVTVDRFGAECDAFHALRPVDGRADARTSEGNARAPERVHGATRRRAT